MNAISNLIWIILGGLFSCSAYILGGVVLCLTVIGIPFGLQCFKIAPMVLMPFGKQVITTPQSTGLLRLLLNIIWLLFGGLWIAVGHVAMGILLCLTIIGIPFGNQHFKLIELSLMPFGKRIE